MPTCKVCENRTTTHLTKTFDDRYGYPKYFDILVCENCGMFQTNPPLQKTEIADLYTKYYPRRDINPRKIGADFQPEFGLLPGVKRWFSGNHRIHYDLPQAKNNEKILEIGCGDGRSLLQLKAMGYDVYGVETDENIKKVRDELNLPIYIGTVEDADFKPEQFNYIIANQLIEHIIDLDSFIESCKKLLKDDGIIIFSTPNADSIYRRLSGKKWINWHIPYHQQVFTKKSLEVLLGKHGLSLMRVRTVTPTPWTLHQINALRNDQAIGIKNPYWNKKENTGNKTSPKPSFPKRITLLPKRALFTIIVFGISVCNKIVDILGQGDCLIITIKK